MHHLRTHETGWVSNTQASTPANIIHNSNLNPVKLAYPRLYYQKLLGKVLNSPRAELRSSIGLSIREQALLNGTLP